MTIVGYPEVTIEINPVFTSLVPLMRVGVDVPIFV